MRTPPLLTKHWLLITSLMVWATLAQAQHPGPQPRPAMSTQTVSSDGATTFVVTGAGVLPVDTPNRLDYVESNMFDGRGVEMLNTLPSRPGNPLNLIEGSVETSSIDKTSPKDDLSRILGEIEVASRRGIVDQQKIQFGLDILEGNPIPGRLYSGFGLLHYTGPEMLKLVQPIYDSRDNVVGGNVDIHQIWYDNHIQSDTKFIDVSLVQEVPFTVTYTIDVLNGGADDFAPCVMYFDDPALSASGMPPMLHVGMDAAFYPMSDGTRYVIKLKHAQGKYYKLTYTWGWRFHPPRVQVTENAGNKVGGRTPQQLESDVFGSAPRSSEAAKLAAIAKIGELAPAKRMWQALREARTATPERVAALMVDALRSFNDWSHRTHLPRGVQADPNADVTLFYVNNTIYGNARTFANWVGRGSLFRATLLNGDHFPHAYVNVDFGGSRGWENQFQTLGGPGASHTFGRMHLSMNTAMPLDSITVPVASADGLTPGLHKVEIILNHDAPERITLYQFDPLHHDVAVFSLH